MDRRRGQRITTMVTELRRVADTLLFIENLDEYLGNCPHTGIRDAFSLLLVPFGQDRLQFIGTTTPTHFHEYVEPQVKLGLRMQAIPVEPASPDLAVAILQGLRKRWEEFHGLSITDEALEEAVRLASWYTQRMGLPEAAIDVIDEVCTCLRLRAAPRPPNLGPLESEIARLQREKEQAVAAPISNRRPAPEIRLANCKSNSICSLTSGGKQRSRV